MKISLILGHPYNKSFNYAIAEVVLAQLKNNEHEVFFHDLYGEKFDPVVTGRELMECTSGDELVERHCKEIMEAEGIIIIHPNWWGQPPGILKGWVDRVLRPGVAYSTTKDESGKSQTKGILKANRALVINTSNTPMDRELEVLGDPLEATWNRCTFSFCGVKNFYKKIFCVVEDSTLEERKAWLEEAKELVDTYFPKAK